MNPIVKITIRTKDPAQIRDLITHRHLDVNCGGPRCVDGVWVLEAYCTVKDAKALRVKDVHIEIDEHFESNALARRAEVGKGNRYANRQAIPRGLGRKEA